jgi:DUF4097 and DUF4098 domain-containing protein YvlB
MQFSSGRFRNLALLAALLACGSLMAAALDTGAADERIQKNFNLRSGAAVTVRHDRGSLKITGWDKEQAEIEAVKHYEGDPQYRDQWLRETNVTFDAAADHLTVKVERPHDIVCFWNCNTGGRVDITMHVPKRVALELDADRNDVVVDTIEGNVRVSSDRSPVELRHVTGAIRVNSDRGPVRLRGVEADDLRIDTDRSNIEITESRLRKGGELNADRGNITVRLAQDEKLNLDVDGDRRSSVHTDFPLTTRGSWGSERMQGAINGGGPTLRVSAHRGTVSIEKGFASTGRMF